MSGRHLFRHLLHRQAHRLLGIQVFSGLQGFYVDFVVGRNGGGVHENVKIAVGQQLVNVGIPLGHVKPLCVFLSPLGNDVAHSHQFCLGNVGHLRNVNAFCDGSAAN